MKKKFFLNIITTIILLFLIAANGIFLKDVSRYAFVSIDIHSIEKSGNSMVYTKDGEKNGWEVYRPKIQKKYQEKMKEKSELIDGSDVANWIATSAESITGRIIRTVAIMISAAMLVLAAYTLIRVLLQDMGYLIKILRID